MKIWFTADTHFGHGNVIRYNKRPYSSGSEMDTVLIENWNKAIQPNDTIYHLGDFTLQGKKLAEHYFSRLNGRIHVVPGGHDRSWNKKYDFFSRSGHPVVVLPPLVTIKVPLRYGRVYKEFKALLEEAGLPDIRFHDLRHTAASQMITHSVDNVTVSKRLGHSKVSTTLDHYGHLVPGAQEQAAAVMDDLTTPVAIMTEKTAPKLHRA